MIIRLTFEIICSLRKESSITKKNSIVLKMPCKDLKDYPLQKIEESLRKATLSKGCNAYLVREEHYEKGMIYLKTDIFSIRILNNAK